MITGKTPLQKALDKIEEYFVELESNGIFTEQLHREYVIDILETMDAECQNINDIQRVTVNY